MDAPGCHAAAETPSLKVLFAHGAGLPSAHPWMQHWKSLLGALGEVVTFDYPYMAQGRKRPDRHPVLLEAHRAALPDGPVVLVGKSMGGRIGLHLALEVDVRGCVCLGFPLVSGSGKVRDRVLLEQRTPVCFVQGTRDRMAPLDHLNAVRERMQVATQLHVVETGDHSLRCTKTYLKTQPTTQEAMDQDAMRAIVESVSAW